MDRLKADRGVRGGKDWGPVRGGVLCSPLAPRSALGRQATTVCWWQTKAAMPGHASGHREALTTCCAESFFEGDSLQPGRMSCDNNTQGNGVGGRAVVCTVSTLASSSSWGRRPVAPQVGGLGVQAGVRPAAESVVPWPTWSVPVSPRPAGSVDAAQVTRPGWATRRTLLTPGLPPSPCSLDAVGVQD